MVHNARNLYELNSHLYSENAYFNGYFYECVKCTLITKDFPEAWLGNTFLYAPLLELVSRATFASMTKSYTSIE